MEEAGGVNQKESKGEWFAVVADCRYSLFVQFFATEGKKSTEE